MDEATLLEQLRIGNRDAYKFLYQQYYRMIATYVGKNKGNDEDAQDLFQDTVIALIKHVRKPDFTLGVKVSTYFYSIARNIWIRRLKKMGTTTSIDTQSDANTFVEFSTEDIREKVEYEQKHLIMKRQLEQLGEDCRKLILGFYYQKRKLIDLAGELGYTKEFVKVKKSRCMKSFKKKVQEDAGYRELSR